MEAVLFDLDGTLIDSAPDLADALDETMRRLGRPAYGEETVRRWIGNGATTLVARALSGSREIDPDLDAALLQEALELFMAAYRRRLCERTRLYPGVRETLDALTKRALPMAVVTNKPSAFVAPILEALAIARYFPFALGGDALPRKKPHPMPLLHACERLGVPPERTVMVGDSSNDILAAKAAGMRSVGVRWGYNYGEDIAAYTPDAVIERFEALTEVI